MKKAFLAIIALLANLVLLAQEERNRGEYNIYRNWWDLTYYDLEVAVDFNTKSIKGHNTVFFKRILDENPGKIQIDLQNPMVVDAISSDGKALNFEKNGDHYLIDVTQVNANKGIRIDFHGKPPISKNAPWESGLVWTQDIDDKPWVASACQDLGSSMWWPSKDHPKDEVDSMQISIICPRDLIAVSNGRLEKVMELPPNSKKFVWKVRNPINGYGVNLSVGNYTYYKEKIKGIQGNLDASYYVIPRFLAKAKRQFLDAHRTIEAFEYWFGPYPFYKDGYKLVQVPYLGMEHQSCVTYGNKFENGYRGYDLSGSGWGLKFDYIIVHESGHEWFANSITNSNVADMWIHEGFTAYSENLFVEYHFGEKAAEEYVIGTRKNIANLSPVIGNYALGKEGSGDMYPKGANMLHTLRTMVNDKEKWRNILLDINKTFYHKTVSSAEMEAFLIEKTALDLEGFFDQYLRDTKIPILNYKVKGKKVIFNFSNCNSNFNMLMHLSINGNKESILVGSKKTKFKAKQLINKVEENNNYYIQYQEI